MPLRLVALLGQRRTVTHAEVEKEDVEAVIHVNYV
jgi:hypothetical protein